MPERVHTSVFMEAMLFTLCRTFSVPEKQTEQQDGLTGNAIISTKLPVADLMIDRNRYDLVFRTFRLLDYILQQ